MIRRFRDLRPEVGAGCFVAETAAIIGDVVIGVRSSIWYGAVLRGDVFSIRVGEETSIQDNTVIHVTGGKHATRVGSRSTVGHSVILHGCTVGDLCVVGMGSTVLDRAEIGDGSIVGAGALVTPGTKIPPGVLAVGAPARVKRPLTDEERASLVESADHYVALARAYLADPGQ